MKRGHPRHYRPFYDEEPYSPATDGMSWEEFSADTATFPLDEGLTLSDEKDGQQGLDYPNDSYKGGFPLIGEAEPMWFD